MSRTDREVTNNNGNMMETTNVHDTDAISDLCNDHFGGWGTIAIFGFVNHDRRRRLLVLFALDSLYRNVRQRNIR